MYDYSISEWVFIFYLYCFLGWCFECTVVSASQRKFINRGFLLGPILPIYGTGAVLVLYTVLPFKDNFFSIFFVGMISATILEYITGVIMESIFKIRYWDYSSHKFQFQGRICLQSSIAWGILSIILISFLHKPIEKLTLYIPQYKLLILTVIFSIVFIIDIAYSFYTAFGLNKLLAEITKIKTELEQSRMHLLLLKEDKLYHYKNQYYLSKYIKSKNIVSKEELKKRIEDFLLENHIHLEAQIKKLGFLKSNLIRSNPSATSKHFSSALKEIRNRFKK